MQRFARARAEDVGWNGDGDESTSTKKPDSRASKKKKEDEKIEHESIEQRANVLCTVGSSTYVACIGVSNLKRKPT